MIGTNGVHLSAPADQLLNRLNEPQTADALNRLLDHADLLAYSVTALDGVIQRGEELTDNISSSVAELRGSVPTQNLPSVAQLSRLLEQLPQLLSLLDRVAVLASKPEFQTTLDVLSRRETLESLNQLLSHTDLIAFVLSGVSSLVQRSDELVENVRDGLQEVSGNLPSNTNIIELLESIMRLLPYLPRLIAVAPKFIQVIERVEPLIASPEFDALMTSRVFEPKTLNMIGQAGDAMVASYEQEQQVDQQIGILGLIRALRDPDIQHALALVVGFGKRFGQSMK